jgi:regulator of ribonuclease activity A
MEFMTADICDDLESKAMVAEPLLRSFGGRPRFWGRVVTLKVHDDNVLVREALEEPGDGRVLVVDGGGSLRVALLGDRLAAIGAANGWAGVVIHGCIRDSREIAGIDLGVFALATHPRKSRKHGDGQKGVSVSFAGITFRPGEYVYADEDGLLLLTEPYDPGE